VRSLCWIPLLLLVACAGHTSGGQSPEALKTAAEHFFQDVRWKDYTGATGVIVAEKQDAFAKARRVGHDSRELEITDYDLESIKIAPDALSGQAVVNLSWMRLPSVTVKTAEIGTDFVYRNGQWRVLRMDGGPFADLL
jgi:hypothetical protein